MKMIVTVSLVVVVALAGAVFDPSAANAQDQGTTTYKVEMTRINGDRSSVAGVQAADKVPVNAGNPCDDITVTVAAGSADSVILAAADAKSSCHSITTGSRYIDASGNVHNFQSGKRTYWLIVKPATPTPTPTPTSTPAPTSAPDTTYTVEMTRIDGDRSSVAGVQAADKVPVNAGNPCDDITVTVPAGSADSVILAAADAKSSCHSITTGSRYIDTDGNVHNFQSGKRTYWLITKSEVNVVEPDPDPDRQNVGTNQLTLTGTIADQKLSQGVLYTSATAFPAATGIDGTVIYSVLGLPSGITMDTATRKLTGTATTAKAETQFTYTATDSDTDTATLTFNLSVLVDYDADDDGLIEVGNLAQLNAIRWDLNGDGVADPYIDTDGDGDADESHMQAVYDAAFPYPLPGMGCPTSGSPTGCIGYELTADLDFDTNSDGKTNIAGDTYWGDQRGNDSRGWQPIGDRRVPFTAMFDGNAYKIKNLYVYKNSTNLGGLFGRIAKGADIRSLNLVGGEVSDVELAGSIAAEVFNGGAINYCSSNVEVSGSVWVGGLVGENWGSIKNSSATGAVTHTTSWGYAGGLAGRSVFDESIIENSFAHGAVTGASTVHMGGLVGMNASAEIKNSYSIGAVSAGSNTGGMVGSHAGFGDERITGSYWDTTASGRSDSAGGTGKTTTELQTPTTATGIYAGWDTIEWDFGTASEYPDLY